MNVLVVSGNLSKDPELRKTISGTSVASSTIAVNRARKNANGEKETDFIAFSCFGQTADYLVKYAHKGDRAELSGRLESHSYTDKQGNSRVVWEMIAEQVTIFNKKEESDKPKPITPENAYYDVPNEDDLPF
jgi:single-strand DNA-binding protein